MSIWKVHRVMIVTAALFSGAFGTQLLRYANGEAWKIGMGVFSLVACGGLIAYFRWFQKKTSSRSFDRSKEIPE
jgi:hypothetical protein